MPLRQQHRSQVLRRARRLLRHLRPLVPFARPHPRQLAQRDRHRRNRQSERLQSTPPPFHPQLLLRTSPRLRWRAPTRRNPLARHHEHWLRSLPRLDGAGEFHRPVDHVTRPEAHGVNHVSRRRRLRRHLSQRQNRHLAEPLRQRELVSRLPRQLRPLIAHFYS